MSKIYRDKMETEKQRDPNKTTIITSSEMNQRTFRDEESWASLESTILGGNCAVHDETESSSSCATDEIDSAKDKSKLATVNEEQDCTDETREKHEFSKLEEEAGDEEVVEDDNNVLNMNIDAIDDEEVFFDCPTILSPRPYFLRSTKFRPVLPRPPLSQTRSFLNTKTTYYNGTTTSGLGTSTGDSGLDEERTGAMIGQILDDFNDMGQHAQSTPKIISETSELGSSISSANNLASEDKNDKDDCVVKGDHADLESTKKRLEFPMDNESENDTSKKRKKKIEVPAEMYEFVKNLDSDDNGDEYDSNNNIITSKKRLDRPSEIVRRMKVLCLTERKIGQKSLVPVRANASEKNVDLSEGKGSGEKKIEDLLLGKALVKRKLKAVNERNGSQKESNSMNETEVNNNKKLEISETAKKSKKISAKNSDPTNCEQSGSHEKESNSMNESEANNNKKKLEISETAKKSKKISAKNSDPTNCEQSGSQNESNSMNESEANNNKKKLEISETAKKSKKISAKNSDPTSCEQSSSQKESNSMNESEANNNNNKKKLEISETAKKMPGAKNSNPTSCKQSGNVSSTRNIRAPKPINKFYKCRSPVDKVNKENYYAGKYSNVKKMISPLLPGLEQPTQRVAKMKEFFENRSRVSTNSTSKKSLIGQKKTPKGPSFHTTIAMKLRRSSPKLSQASHQASSLIANTYNNINDASTFLLTRNQSRFLRPSSCSDYSSTTSSCADKFDQMSAAQKSKSMEDLSSESAQAAELRRFAMSRHITVRAYLKVTQRTTLQKRTPKKQLSPQQRQLLPVNSPKKIKSDIMKRKSFGFVSSPVKPVTELRKIFSPSMATNAKTVKKHAGHTSKTLPHIVINRN